MYMILETRLVTVYTCHIKIHVLTIGVLCYSHVINVIFDHTCVHTKTHMHNVYHSLTKCANLLFCWLI